MKTEPQTVEDFLAECVFREIDIKVNLPPKNPSVKTWPFFGQVGAYYYGNWIASAVLKDRLYAFTNAYQTVDGISTRSMMYRLRMHFHALIEREKRICAGD